MGIKIKFNSNNEVLFHATLDEFYNLAKQSKERQMFFRFQTIEGICYSIPAWLIQKVSYCEDRK